MKNLQQQLHALFGAIQQEAKSNSAFAERLVQALGSATEPPARSNRRSPAVFDPFLEHQKGAAWLRERLEALDLEQLKDILAEYGMDRSKLAMKWKDRQRIIDLVVNTVASRATKGDAFRSTSNSISRAEHLTDTQSTGDLHGTSQ